MKKPNAKFQSRGLSLALAFATVAALCLAPAVSSVSAQSGGTIDAGMTIPVRTNEEINASTSDGRVFTGSVSEDVRDRQGRVAIPRGAYVELMVRNSGNNEYTLDIESVTINGRRLGVDAATSVRAEKEGVGVNERTGRYVGGGAAIGAIIGAITGGAKGAAIGGGVGAAAGAGAQVLTKGKNVNVPAESQVTFRLEQPLRTAPDTGFSRNGAHYHDGFGTTAGNTTAYDAGLRAGRADKRANRTFNAQSSTYRGDALNEYASGYERGFDESVPRNQQSAGSILIGADRYVTWKGPATSQVFVQVDNEPKQLFASGASGTQPAPWISYGHKYVFTLEDTNGREIARDENDLRQRRRLR
jgi:hypothetical protein